MSIEFRGSNSATTVLINMANQNEHIRRNGLKIFDLPACSIGERDMAHTIEMRTEDFTWETGTFCMYVAHPYGGLSGQLIGTRKSSEKPFSEDVADILIRYEKRYKEPIAGFLVRFIPEVNGKLKPEQTFARIFNTIH